jgi:hypothetical protein
MNSNLVLASVIFPALKNVYGSLQIVSNSILPRVSFPALLNVQSVAVMQNPSLLNVSFSALSALNGDLNVNLNNLNLEHVEFPLLINTSGAVFVSRCAFANFTMLNRANTTVPYSCAAGLGNNYLPENSVICVPCFAGAYGSGGEIGVVWVCPLIVPKGNTSCIACPNGQSSAPGSSGCVAVGMCVTLNRPASGSYGCINSLLNVTATSLLAGSWSSPNSSVTFASYNSSSLTFTSNFTGDVVINWSAGTNCSTSVSFTIIAAPVAQIAPFQQQPCGGLFSVWFCLFGMIRYLFHQVSQSLLLC